VRGRVLGGWGRRSVLVNAAVWYEDGELDNSIQVVTI